MLNMSAVIDKSRRSKIVRKTASFAMLVLLVIGLLHLKVSLEVERNYRPYIFDARYDLPGPKILRAASLNYRTAAASLVWVRGVQHFAQTFVARRASDDVTQYAQTLVELDPYFYKVYSWHSAARMLAAGYPTPADTEAANDLLEVGMGYFPRDWRLPHEAAANYIGFTRGVDRPTRLRQLERGIGFAEAAAARPQSPDSMIFLAIRFREKLARLRNESNSAASAAVDRIDPEMLVRLYFLAQSQMARESLFNRLRRANATDQLTSSLRAYALQQSKWYDTSSKAYLPFATFTTLTPGPSPRLAEDVATSAKEQP
ncbi:hypothetical protein FIV42_04050 [Persicimonas caeni]|uniref:Uncharacterized protein n=1 Tax=Persicimonas caeni TaxID=2292766 RepID=A0A4Y6PPA8_PERCE|nr:hypothetical protein [Persicimonas caeni]QDG49939.1 hypothetical protein FIV42_04050 [Persicimonas caeni]QED31160.1 hypothetical protein FRD00_04045 [Persicimonas caeni]